MTYQRQKPPPGIQLNKNHPLAQGLVACWLLNEGSGLRANDLSGNNNTGTLTDFEPFSSTSEWAGGNFGTALIFDGTKDYVDCGNNPSLRITTNITADVWQISPRQTQKGLLSKYNIGAAQRAWLMTSGTSAGVNDNRFRVVVSDDGSANVGHRKDYLSSFVTYDSTPHHVAFTFNTSGLTSGLTLYVDGRQDLNPTVQANDPITSIFNTPVDVTIGQFWNTAPANFWTGTIIIARIWNRALSSNEIRQLYAQPFGMFKFNLSIR